MMLVGDPSHRLRRRSASCRRICHSSRRAVRGGIELAPVVDKFFVKERIEPRIVMETENVEI